MRKVLMDTDIGGDIDDAVCLAYLLREPECRLLGITTVCGESERRAMAADAICRAAGREVPIVAGEDLPLRPIPVYPTPEGAGALERWEHAEYRKGDAPAFLYEVLCAHPHEVDLIAIGNMTNIALLFQRFPDSPGLLRSLHAMNGYFGEEALPEPWYNWNSWADPLASEIVFSARVPVHRTVTLEVTDRLTLDAGEAERLLPSASRLFRAVRDFGGAWLEQSGKLTLHDPLAAVCLFHKEVCSFRRGKVRVETEREDRMGATAFREAPEGTAEISAGVDAARFFQYLKNAFGA